MVVVNRNKSLDKAMFSFLRMKVDYASVDSFEVAKVGKALVTTVTCEKKVVRRILT